jgi:hypothetical protein
LEKVAVEKNVAIRFEHYRQATQELIRLLTDGDLNTLIYIELNGVRRSRVVMPGTNLIACYETTPWYLFLLRAIPSQMLVFSTTAPHVHALVESYLCENFALSNGVIGPKAEDGLASDQLFARFDLGVLGREELLISFSPWPNPKIEKFILDLESEYAARRL